MQKNINAFFLLEMKEAGSKASSYLEARQLLPNENTELERDKIAEQTASELSLVIELRINDCVRFFLPFLENLHFRGYFSNYGGHIFYNRPASRMPAQAQLTSGSMAARANKLGFYISD